MRRHRRSSILLLALALLLAAVSIAGAQRKAGHREARQTSGEKNPGEAYIFTYFKGNGEDGLHLAYSTDGLTWRALNNDRSLLQPAVGRDKLMRDPHITIGPDGMFHMVWTSSWTDPVIGYAASRDLINWSEQRAITPMTKEPTARNVWAPETFYDAKTKRYLLFWATTIPGRFPETEQSGDNNYNHRIYLTTTQDFKTFAPTSLFYDQGFNVIDATIVKDGSRYIMFLKDETRQPVAKKNIRYAVSKRAMGPYGAASEPVTGKYWAEGPTAIKIGGRWIVYFDKYRDHRYGAVASVDLKQWEDISAQVQFPAGARHGTVLRVPQAVLTRLLELK
ncbi:MAG TPA: glycoside hydrolase family 43 protein [Pyrinomonadaceae bacterium]